MTPASGIGEDMLDGGDVLLGDALRAGLPEVAERHLKLASRTYQNDLLPRRISGALNPWRQGTPPC